MSVMRLLGIQGKLNIQPSGRVRTKKAGKNQEGGSEPASTISPCCGASTPAPRLIQAHALRELVHSCDFKYNLYTKTPKFTPLIQIFLLSRHTLNCPLSTSMWRSRRHV